MMNWLRNSMTAAGILTILRLYVGFKFLTSGWGKLTGDKPFDASGFIKGAIAKSLGEKPLCSNGLVISCKVLLCHMQMSLIS